MEVKNALTRTTTLGKTSTLGMVWGIVEMADGTLVLSDAERHTICTLSLSANVNIVAGNGTAGYLDGIGDKSMFNTPKGLALTNEGEILVADSANHRIRQVSPSGMVSTISGTARRGSMDGPVKSATWDLPVEIAHIVATETRILVASFSSPFLRCIHDGIVTTLNQPSSLIGASAMLGASLASSPSNSFSPSADAATPSKQTQSEKRAAQLLSPDERSPIFALVKEVGSPHLAATISKVEQRIVKGNVPLTDGALDVATFRSMNAVVSNNRGDIILLDCTNHAIRLITVEGRVTTLSGHGTPGHHDGVAGHSRLSFPRTLVLSKRGDLLIADTGNCVLRRVELGASLRQLWTHSHLPSRNFNHIIPTRDAQPPPLWSDLVWGTSNAGNWRLHRCILFSRCPHLGEAAVQSKFLDLKVPPDAYLAFWEFVYNDIFPVPKADVVTTTLFVQFTALLEAAQHEIAAEYSQWLVGHSIDALGTFDEILAVLPIAMTLKQKEIMKTIIRIIMRRNDQPKADEALQTARQTLASFSDSEFQTWLKQRINSTTTFSKKLGEKPPPSPFGFMERDLGTLLVREEATHRIRWRDIALKGHADQLSAHRAILYQQWPLLTTLLEGTTMEKLPLVLTLPAEIAEMRMSSLAGLLWYFYTGSLDKLKDSDDCTELARMYEHLAVEDPRLRAHLMKTGFVDLDHISTSPNLWLQPDEPAPTSCTLQ